MAQLDISKRDHLIDLIKTMDETLIQRIADFAQGLVIGNQEQDIDWWDEISQEQRQRIEQGSQEAQQGLGKPFDQIMQKYK